MPKSTRTPGRGQRGAKSRTCPTFAERSIYDIRRAPENDKLYRPVDPADPDIVALAESIREHGLFERLVVTLDGYLISGHRRHVAAFLAGLATVPCRIEPFRRADEPDRFLRLLREHNRQRDKTADEKLREELISISPDAAYEALLQHRAAQARIAAPAMKIVGRKRRKEISDAKQPMLDAILAVLETRRKFWPLSDRYVHYALLDTMPLRHAGKPDSRYDNDLRSYKDLTDLLTRARLAGDIEWEAISDETRPVVTWEVHRGTRTFIRRELDGFLRGYWRDLQASQPNHIELLAEKNTLLSIVKPVAADYCIPLTVGRGYSSLAPRRAMAERFEASGKEKLILLMVSDFDPDGEEIAQSFARSMRDDFDIEAIHPMKVALTAEQVERLGLPPVMQAKASSMHHRKFVQRHGRNVWEVEALAPEHLQAELRAAIESVLDLAAFNRELDAEKQDATYLAGLRATVAKTLASLTFADGARVRDEEDA